MDIYTASTGVQMTLSWASRSDYLEAEEFLKNMGAACGSGTRRAGAAPFFYLKDERQLDALFNLRDTQRRR